MRRRLISTATPLRSVAAYTALAAVMSVILLGLFAWWFAAAWWLMAVYATVAVCATLSVPLLYRWLGYHDADEAQWWQARNLNEHHALMAKLQYARASLQSLRIHAAVQQADTLIHILNDYRSVVETRFMGKQFTPLTYLNAARAVQEHVIQNLSDMVAVGHSLAGLSRHQADSTRTEQAELTQEQQQRLQTLLEENNQFFAALNETAVEIANIRSYSEFERMDTLTRLISLAQIANQTGNR